LFCERSLCMPANSRNFILQNFSELHLGVCWQDCDCRVIFTWRCIPKIRHDRMNDLHKPKNRTSCIFLTFFPAERRSLSLILCPHVKIMQYWKSTHFRVLLIAIVLMLCGKILSCTDSKVKKLEQHHKQYSRKVLLLRF